jgi:hypothetical protein
MTWQPLIAVDTNALKPATPVAVAAVARHYNITEGEAQHMLYGCERGAQCYVNDIYQVQATPYGPGNACLHLNIRRHDGGMVKDWRHLQWIKNEIAGEEREAVELYPAESRKVDTSNKWHLWVLPEGERMNVGWPERDVSHDACDIPGLEQRAL